MKSPSKILLLSIVLGIVSIVSLMGLIKRTVRTVLFDSTIDTIDPQGLKPVNLGKPYAIKEGWCIPIPLPTGPEWELVDEKLKITYQNGNISIGTRKTSPSETMDQFGFSSFNEWQIAVVKNYNGFFDFMQKGSKLKRRLSSGEKLLLFTKQTKQFDVLCVINNEDNTIIGRIWNRDANDSFPIWSVSQSWETSVQILLAMIQMRESSNKDIDKP